MQTHFIDNLMDKVFFNNTGRRTGESPETFLLCRMCLQRPAFLFNLIPFYNANTKQVIQ